MAGADAVAVVDYFVGEFGGVEVGEVEEALLDHGFEGVDDLFMSVLRLGVTVVYIPRDRLSDRSHLGLVVDGHSPDIWQRRHLRRRPPRRWYQLRGGRGQRRGSWCPCWCSARWVARLCG